MGVAVLAVAAIAYWDAARESAAALEDFAEEPVSLAAALADDVDPLVTGRAIERPEARRVFVRRPGDPAFHDTTGAAIVSDGLAAAATSGHAPWTLLDRDASSALGLPHRSSIAAVRSSDRAGDVVVVSTAARVRDRERRAEWRLLISIALGAGLVIGFGAAAMRRQRKELALERDLAVAAIARERDERLVHADKLATMGALATGIAHEISTPLGVIVARADAINDASADGDKVKRAAKIILEQSDRITAVIRGFLGLARGGSPPLVRAAADDLVRRALELTEHRFSGAGVHVSHSIAPDLPRVACDPLLFEHVLVNLLLNACDAAGAGGTVELAVSEHGGRVAFSVTDDGPGISEEAARHAVEPFFTTKPEGKGSGLGLAIASEIVKHHRGTLAIAPRAGKRGTEAVVSLPSAFEGEEKRDG
jgi:signal transduction histidine kinase